MRAEPIACAGMRNRIFLLAGKRAFGFGLLLYVFLSGFAAWGGLDITRVYIYRGFDTNGVLVVKGVITLRLDDTDRVTGDWNLRILERDRFKLKALGKQDGSGKISGQITGDRIFLNLSPGELGDNVYLDGEVTRANIFRINGRWGHYGDFTGKLSEGDFEMVRKPDPPKRK